VFEAVPEQSLRFAPRIALVIGNDTYTKSWATLHQSANDATAMAAALRKADFTLIGGGPQLNIDAAKFHQLVEETVASVRAHPGAIVTVYFSGHGFAYRGSNMLAPIDARQPSTLETASTSIGVADVAQAISAAGSGLTILFLDACREAIGGTGAFVDAPVPPRTFIGFGTYFGTWSTEGAGTNSEYTLALIRTLGTHWDRLSDLHLAVATLVSANTKMEQVPVYRAAPGVAESRAHIGLSDRESAYARASTNRTATAASPNQPVLGARCASFGTINLLGTSVNDALRALTEQTYDATLLSPVNAEEVLAYCRDAYNTGVRDPATIRGFAIATVATAQNASLRSPSPAEMAQAESLLLQAAEGHDGIAETFLAMMESGLVKHLVNTPVNNTLAGERLLHAIEEDGSPVGWVVGTNLIKPGLGWPIEDYKLTRAPARGFRMIVRAAQKFDPMALELLYLRVPESLGYSEPLDVRGLLRSSLGRAPPVDAIGAITLRGLTIGQTLYALAMLDAYNGRQGPPDLPEFVRLAMVSEAWYPKFSALINDHGYTEDIVGCALVGGVTSRNPLPLIPRNMQMGVRFFKMAADQGRDHATRMLQAINAGIAAPCSASADLFNSGT